MTGTGTQADPFVVDTWPDFVTAVGTANAYVEFSEGGGNIDLNNHAPTGISTVSIKCVSIKGNGWTLSNIYCAGKDAFYLTSDVRIVGLNFLDFYMDDQGSQCKFFGGDDNRRQYAFSLCSFTGIINGTAESSRSCIFYWGYYWSEANLSQCAINVSCNGTAVLINAGGTASSDNYLEFCNIEVKGNSDDIFNDALDLRNCYLTGSSLDTEIDTRYSSKSNYNVFNIDFRAASAFACTGNSGAINLINTDLLPANAVIGSGFIGVTTTQLHDAAYLGSLGFPIGVD